MRIVLRLKPFFKEERRSTLPPPTILDQTQSSNSIPLFLFVAQDQPILFQLYNLFFFHFFPSFYYLKRKGKKKKKLLGCVVTQPIPCALLVLITALLAQDKKKKTKKNK